MIFFLFWVTLIKVKYQILLVSENINHRCMLHHNSVYLNKIGFYLNFNFVINLIFEKQIEGWELKRSKCFLKAFFTYIRLDLFFALSHLEIYINITRPWSQYTFFIINLMIIWSDIYSGKSYSFLKSCMFKRQVFSLCSFLSI